MKQDAKTQESIVALLARIYEDILDIEQEFNLIVGQGDFRPRIEYFHDAIRAFTAQETDRLTIELLAYDLASLRYIQGLPGASFKPGGDSLSASSDVLKGGMGQDLAPPPKRLDRKARERLAELYQHYAVMFAALLKPFADNDYQDRTDTLNQDAQELNAIIHEIEKLSQGRGGSVDTAAALANQIDNPELNRLLLAFLREKRFKSPSDSEKLTAALKGEVKKKDKNIKAIEEAHMNYALSQLGVYEASKDLLKKMAGQGVNLVGKFVEASVADTKRSMGR